MSIFRGKKRQYKKVVSIAKLTQNTVKFRRKATLWPLYTFCCQEVYHEPTQEAPNAVDMPLFSTALEGEKARNGIFFKKKHPES